MTRKFIQMGMTRARRYANWKGGRKYDKGGEKKQRWEAEGKDGEEGRKRREKEEASELFKGFWRRCLEDEGYQALKVDWIREKLESENQRKKAMNERKGGMKGYSEEESDEESQREWKAR